MKIPTSTFHLEPWRKLIVLSLTSIAMCLPIIVFIGWLSANKPLILLREDFYPMTFNTSVILISLGLSLLLQTLHYRTAALIAILISLILSSAFGFESITGFDLGIDEMLFKLNVQFPYPFPPRPAGYTSLGAFLLSICILCLFFRDRAFLFTWIAGILCATTFSLFLMILYGYLGSFQLGTYSFDDTRVAVHTAISLLLLSIVCLYLTFHSVYIFPKQALYFYFFLGFSLSIGVAVATNHAWKKQARINLQSVLKIHASEMANLLRLKLKKSWLADLQFKNFLELDEEHLEKFIQSKAVSALGTDEKFLNLLILNPDGTLSKTIFGPPLSDNLKNYLKQLKNAPDGYFPLSSSNEVQFLALKIKTLLKNSEKEMVFIYDSESLLHFNIPPDLSSKLTRIKIFFDRKLSCEHIISQMDEKAVAYSNDTFMNLNFCIVLGANERFLKEFGGTLGSILWISGLVIGIVAGWFLYLLQETRSLVMELIKADSARSLFFANVSHEIRTPLHGIIGVTSLLKTTPLDGKQMRYLTILDLSSQHLLDLIDNILDITKIESGSLVIVKQTCDLESVCGDIVKLIKIRCDEKHLLLSFKYLADAPGEIKLAVGAFKQILINILGNAVKFTEAGSILLEVHLQALDGNKGLIEVKVTDTGIGIPKNKFKLIFTKFARVDEQLSIKKGGTGIGLYLSQLLVKGLGGTIRFESEENKGTTFYVTIPTEFSN